MAHLSEIEISTAAACMDEEAAISKGIEYGPAQFNYIELCAEGLKRILGASTSMHHRTGRNPNVWLSLTNIKANPLSNPLASLLIY